MFSPREIRFRLMQARFCNNLCVKYHSKFSYKKKYLGLKVSHGQHDNIPKSAKSYTVYQVFIQSRGEEKCGRYSFLTRILFGHFRILTIMIDIFFIHLVEGKTPYQNNLRIYYYEIKISSD